MTRSDEQSSGISGDLWETLIGGLERGDLQSSLDHLQAGRPIYVAEDNTPDTAAIKEYPDGRRELIRFDNGGEHIVGPLASIESRI